MGERRAVRESLKWHQQLRRDLDWKWATRQILGHLLGLSFEECRSGIQELRAHFLLQTREHSLEPSIEVQTAAAAAAAAAAVVVVPEVGEGG